MRTVASSQFYSVLVAIVLSSACWHSPGAEVELCAARGCPRQPRIRRDSVPATIPCSGRRSSEASGATLHQRRCQAAHVSSRPPLPRPHRASSARRFWPDPSIRVRRCCAGPYTSRHVVVGVSRQAGFSSIPCGTAPSWMYRQSAIRSFRARATIMTLRRRPREPPRRSWNQRESAQPGW